MKTEEITLEIAGFNIQIRFLPSELAFEKNLLKREILSYYRGFAGAATNKKVDFRIHVKDERHYQIVSRRNMKFASLYSSKGASLTTFYYVSLSQFTLLVAMVIQDLLKNNGFILHASGVFMNGKMMLFTGPSEAGKSTVSQLLSARFKKLADDSIIIRKIDGTYYAYQTPLIEKNTHLFSRGKRRYEIGGIFLLRKTSENPSYRPLTHLPALVPILSAQLWVGRNHAKQIRMLIGMLSAGIPFFELFFPNDGRTVKYMQLHQQDFRSQPGGR